MTEQLNEKVSICPIFLETIRTEIYLCSNDDFYDKKR